MFIPYIADRVTTESKTIRSFYLKRPYATPLPAFLPDQHVNIRVTPGAGQEQVTRSYTLSDSPDRDYLRLTIKRAGNCYRPCRRHHLLCMRT